MAVEAYHDPENFRIALNACIQAIRNITFALQSQKAAIENFDKWYAPWQAALRNDFIMKWCVEARNRIVKQSDLETHSIALASVVSGYGESPVNTLRVSPFASSQDIALHLKENVLPQPLSEKGYLYVERRWVVDDLLGIEILEALAYALSLMRSLLLDVVTQRGPIAFYGTSGPPTPRSLEDGVIDERYLPDFAKSFRNSRTVWLKLSSSECFQYVDETRHVPPHGPERAKARYQLEDLVRGLDKKKTDLRGRIEFLLAIGKRMLEVDGHHWPHVFLIDRKNRLTIVTPHIAHHEEKPIIWSEIAKRAKSVNATVVIAILETWVAPFDPAFPGRRPEQSPDRGEALHATGFTHRGDGYSVVVPFSRTNGKITFGPEQIVDTNRIPWLEPFRSIWRKTIRGAKRFTKGS